jgi:hypothetical protein
MNHHTTNLKVLPCPRPDKGQIQAFAELLLSSGKGCLELRCIGNKSSKRWELKQTEVGFYNDVNALVKDALANHGKRNVYISLNLRQEELLHAAPPNTLNPGEGGKIADVLQRNWLPLDIDTKRPNKRIAATQEELKETLLLQDFIIDFLSSHGIGAIKGMSGNGGHLLILTTPYPVEEHHKRGASQNDKLAVLLRWFAHKFNNEHAEVDTAVFDAPRIWKMYGTTAIKGGNTQERPWRTATFEAPNSLPNPVDVLALFSAEIEEQEQREGQEKPQKRAKENHISRKEENSSHWMKTFKGDLTTIDVVRLFEEANIYHQTIGTNKHSVSCPWEHEHSTPDAQSTVVLWTPQDKVPSFKCLHQSHQTKTIQDVLVWFGKESVEQACEQTFKTLQTEPKKAIKRPRLSEEIENSFPQLPPFPLDVFPSTVQEIVQAYADSVRAPVDIAAVQSLAIVSLALGPDWEIEAKGFQRPSRLWTAIVAPPGSAKTPVMIAMMKPVEQREKYLRDVWEEEIKIWRDKRGAEKNKEEREDRPIQSHVKTDDFNIDSLIAALAHSPQGIILDMDELAQLFGLIEQTHTGGSGRSRGAFLSMWSGKPVSVIRKKSDDLYVKNPYIIVCGGTQPDTLSSLGLTQGDGMIQRFLWSCTESIEEEGYGEKVPTCSRRMWEETIYNAFSLEGEVMKVSSDAISFGNEVIKSHNRRKNEMNKIGFSGFAAMFAKAPDHFHRLVACLHGMDCLFENKPHKLVTLDVFERANKLLEYFLVHSKHCITLAIIRKNQGRNFQALLDKDKELFRTLKALVQDEQTHSTSEWSKLLNNEFNFEINVIPLGVALKRLSALPFSGLSFQRPSTEKKRSRLWKISPQNC